MQKKWYQQLLADIITRSVFVYSAQTNDCNWSKSDASVETKLISLRKIHRDTYATKY